MVITNRFKKTIMIFLYLNFLVSCAIAFVGNEKPILFGSRCDRLLLSRPSSVEKKRNLFSAQTDDDTCAPKYSFPNDLIKSLDLVPLIRLVARHAGTRRGYDGILALVNQDESNISQGIPNRNSLAQSSRRERVNFSLQKFKTSSRNTRRRPSRLFPIASSEEEARKEYDLVDQATLAINDENSLNLTFPPIYGVESNPMDTETTPVTDDDEWLDLLPDDWTLESIVQAEKVIETLQNVKAWAGKEECREWLPGLSEIGSRIDRNNSLSSVYEEIHESVKILRVRSLVDPGGKSTYSFQVNEDRYPILGLLRKRERELFERGGKEFDKAVVEIQGEIEQVEFQIVNGLAQTILSVSSVVHEGLDIISKLDIVFAKAAFGLDRHGVIPKVSNTGRLSIKNFVHPLLTTNSVIEKAVPIDLQLSPEERERVLILSGPNGGGKTLALKSFGVACIFAKLGIPIPVDQSDRHVSPQPRVDFFSHTLVRIGDQQSVVDGESTWTGMLNFCASIIDQVGTSTDDVTVPDDNDSYLVLLDELGSGTDPEAGGAICQALLEQMMINPKCNIVATTHSPRLKGLSYTSSDIGCASVLLKRSESATEYNLPSFKLEYGVIGESYAMGAASRCSPISLPEQVLARSSQLISESSGERDEYFRVLTQSMEEQLERATKELDASETSARDSAKCRSAMIFLAKSYEQELSRLETKLDNCFQQLKDKGVDNLELVGETISELRTVQRKVLNQKELLSQQGLKLLPTSYSLQEGESVVVVADDAGESTTVTVVDPMLGQNEVLVQSSSLFGWNDTDLEKPFVVQRHSLAIWDYDSVWEDEVDTKMTVTSRSDASLRLTSLLSNMNASTNGKVPSSERSTSFTSARERKAAGKKKKGKKKGK